MRMMTIMTIRHVIMALMTNKMMIVLMLMVIMMTCMLFNQVWRM